MSYVDDVLAKVIAKNPSEPEFHQAVTPTPACGRKFRRA